MRLGGWKQQNARCFPIRVGESLQILSLIYKLVTSHTRTDERLNASEYVLFVVCVQAKVSGLFLPTRLPG